MHRNAVQTSAEEMRPGSGTGLEQLRFLENGRAVLCAKVEAKGREFWELNNPEDVPRIEAMLKKMGAA